MDHNQKDFDALVPTGLNEALTAGVTDTRWFAPRPIFHGVLAGIILVAIGWFGSHIWEDGSAQYKQDVGACIYERDYHRDFLLWKI